MKASFWTILFIAFVGCNSIAQSNVRNVSTKVFDQLISSEEGILLDVRTPEEYKQGYIQGSILMNIYDEDFDIRVGNLDKSKPVYVYCKSGGRSARAAKKLQELGFINVINLKGGFTAWKSDGLPVHQEN